MRPGELQMLPDQEFHIVVEFTLAHRHLRVVDAEWQDLATRHAEFIVSPTVSEGRCKQLRRK
jgi:hypothetical protein